MSQPEQIEHPAWCDVENACTADDPVFAFHYTPWIVVGPPAEGDPTIKMRLFTDAVDPVVESEPMLEFEFTGGPDVDGGGYFEAATEQTVALFNALKSLVELQTADAHWLKTAPTEATS